MSIRLLFLKGTKQLMIVRFKLGFFYSKSWPPCQKQANFKGPLLKVLTYTSCTYSRKPQNLLHCNQETNLNCALIMWQQLSRLAW